MKQIQEWLGHSTYVTTADAYSHLDYASKVNAGKTVGDYFGGIKPPKEPAPDEIHEVDVEAPDYSGGVEPEIIEEISHPVETLKPLEKSKAEPEEEIKQSNDEITYEEYQEFLRWKKAMKKKDMEIC